MCVYGRPNTHTHITTAHIERYNKKCKNLTANKHRPYESLANSLVRDATARFHRWRKGEQPTKHPKMITTQVIGKSRTVSIVGISDIVKRQLRLSCDCSSTMCTYYQHAQASIGGKKFTAGEKLLSGKRCGSVVTRVVGGRSVYGLVKQFLRVMCGCCQFYDVAVVEWFSLPTYPDGDPLTVRICLSGVDVNNVGVCSVVSLLDIQPSRVSVGIDQRNECMYMMRLDGVDSM